MKYLLTFKTVIPFTSPQLNYAIVDNIEDWIRQSIQQENTQYLINSQSISDELATEIQNYVVW